MRNFNEDKKIRIPSEIKHYVLSKMLKWYDDYESSNIILKNDGIIGPDNMTIEWKNGIKWGSRWYDTSELKIELEIYTDLDKMTPGWCSVAKSDIIVFCKRYNFNNGLYDIIIMDYKKLVDWWWVNGAYKNYINHMCINEYSYNGLNKWRSTFYPLRLSKFPKEIIISIKRYDYLKQLLKKSDLGGWC